MADNTKGTYDDDAAPEVSEPDTLSLEDQLRFTALIEANRYFRPAEEVVRHAEAYLAFLRGGT